MKTMMAGAGETFKAGVTPLPISIFRHLFKYYSTSGFYFLSLSDKDGRWPLIFPSLNSPPGADLAVAIYMPFPGRVNCR